MNSSLPEAIGSERPLRVVHVTLSRRGGAGLAALRLSRALRQCGVDSRVVVSDGTNDDPGVVAQPRRFTRIRTHLDRLPLRRYPHRNIFAWWSNNWLPTRGLRDALRSGADVVNLHWIGDGWINPHELRGCRVPIVWTLHDSWAFTGGCHYPANCDRHVAGCGQCPQLGSAREGDLSRRNLQRKQAVWSRAEPVFVAPSRWLAMTAGRSGALRERRIEVIANGIDPDVFGPREGGVAKAKYGFGRTDVVLLVFSDGQRDDARKGVELIAPALASMPSAERKSLRLLLVGRGELTGLPPDIGWRRISRVNGDAELADIYAAADAHLLPTRQDNLPNTAVESIACGRAVLGNAVGGMPEIVTSGCNGLLAPEPTPPALAEIVRQYLALGAQARETWGQAARQAFLRAFQARDRARDYLELYRSLLPRRS